LYAPPFYVDSLPWQQPAARRTVFLLSAFPFSRWADYASHRLSKNTRPRALYLRSLLRSPAVFRRTPKQRQS